MQNLTCCFTGHRELSENETERIRADVLAAIASLMEQGVKTFICGGAVGFDMLCGEIIADLRRAGARINLVMALPCKGQDRYFSERDKIRYKNLVESADKVIYTSEHYSKSCMHIRNRFMVDNSAHVIAYCKKLSGGTAYTRNYAAGKGRNIIDIR